MNGTDDLNSVDNPLKKKIALADRQILEGRKKYKQIVTHWMKTGK